MWWLTWSGRPYFLTPRPKLSSSTASPETRNRLKSLMKWWGTLKLAWQVLFPGLRWTSFLKRTSFPVRIPGGPDLIAMHICMTRPCLLFRDPVWPLGAMQVLVWWLYNQGLLMRPYNFCLYFSLPLKMAAERLCDVSISNHISVLLRPMTPLYELCFRLVVPAWRFSLTVMRPGSTRVSPSVQAPTTQRRPSRLDSHTTNRTRSLSLDTMMIWVDF